MRKRSSEGIMEPAWRREYDLHELIKRITRGNVHEEIQFSIPTGKSASTSPEGLRAMTMRSGGKV
jgi:hypothetical protein